MPEQTVLHGVDQQGDSADRPSNIAPDGFIFYDRTLREAIVRDNTRKNWFSISGRMLYSATAPRMMSDDFKGPALDARYVTAKGNDDVAALPALVSGSHLGEVALVSGNAGTGIAADGVALAGPAAVWEAEEGQISFGVKAKLSAITTVWMFIGFTDTLPSDTLEEPVSLNGTTYTTNATDAVGFLFDTAATTDTLRAVGVKDDTDATHVDTAVAPVADTYAEYKVVIETDGSAKLYFNGTLKATIADAVSPGVDLVPIVAVCARATDSRTLTVDCWDAK